MAGKLNKRYLIVVSIISTFILLYMYQSLLVQNASKPSMQLLAELGDIRCQPLNAIPTSPSESQRSKIESQSPSKLFRQTINVSEDSVNVSRKTSLERLLEKYPWLKRGNAIPNVFTNGSGSDILSSHNATLAFLHCNKAGGSTMRGCLKQLSADVGTPLPGIVTYRSVPWVYDKMELSPSQSLKVYHGDYSFGICDKVSLPCSYFVMIRDAYERMASHYLYCHRNRELFDHICLRTGSFNLTVTQWTMRVGSHLFRQLFINPELCSTKYTSHKFLNFVNTTLPDQSGAENITCWKILWLYMDYHLTPTDKEILLQYFIDNLENWFSVIGFTHDMDSTYSLMEKAYDLPFQKSCNQKHNAIWKVPGHDYDIESKRETEKLLSDTLKADEAARMALHYDNELFKKAKEIFQKQLSAMNN